MSTVHKEARLVPQTDVRFRAMPQGGMLVNLKTGACFELNRVGADLWTRLAAGMTVASAIETLRENYDVVPNVVETDALRLCGQLLDAGLVHRQADGETR